MMRKTPLGALLSFPRFTAGFTGKGGERRERENREEGKRKKRRKMEEREMRKEGDRTHNLHLFSRNSGSITEGYRHSFMIIFIQH